MVLYFTFQMIHLSWFCLFSFEYLSVEQAQFLWVNWKWNTMQLKQKEKCNLALREGTANKWTIKQWFQKLHSIQNIFKITPKCCIVGHLCLFVVYQHFLRPQYCIMEWMNDWIFLCLFTLFISEGTISVVA